MWEFLLALQEVFLLCFVTLLGITIAVLVMLASFAIVEAIGRQLIKWFSSRHKANED